MSYLMKRILMQWYDKVDHYQGLIEKDTTEVYDRGDIIYIAKANVTVLSESANGISLRAVDTGIEYYLPLSERKMNGD